MWNIIVTFVSSSGRERGQVEVHYGHTDSLLLNVKTKNLLDDLEDVEKISS